MNSSNSDYQHYSLQLLPFNRSSAQTNTHEQLLSPHEIEGLIALTASQEELSFRLGLSKVIFGDKYFNLNCPISLIKWVK